MQNRSKWKGPFVDFSILEKINEKIIIKTTSRSSIILPFMLGRTIHVHTGKWFLPLKITEDMLGYRLGEFVNTRIRHIYKKKKKKNGTKGKSK